MNVDKPAGTAVSGFLKTTKPPCLKGTMCYGIKVGGMPCHVGKK